MQAIDVQTTDDRVLISLDRQMIDREFVVELVDRLRLEYLARKVDFDQEIEQLGEEIKADWWAENKHRFIETPS
jgi:hypothetical protein